MNGQPNLISKNFTESFLAETNSFRHVSTCEQTRISLKLSHAYDSAG